LPFTNPSRNRFKHRQDWKKTRCFLNKPCGFDLKLNVKSPGSQIRVTNYITITQLYLKNYIVGCTISWEWVLNSNSEEDKYYWTEATHIFVIMPHCTNLVMGKFLANNWTIKSLENVVFFVDKAHKAL
jgi:hypothetical protein